MANGIGQHFKPPWHTMIFNDPSVTLVSDLCITLFPQKDTAGRQKDCEWDLQDMAEIGSSAQMKLTLEEIKGIYFSEVKQKR